MAGYQDLSEFERGVTVRAREMGYSISERAMKFGFSHNEERDQRRLTRIIKRDSATLPQIAANFNAGPSTSVAVRTIQGNLIEIGFRSRRHTRVPLLTARNKALRLARARQHRHSTVDAWKHFA
ncbi:HTH_Tnp_Tc3_2 domain-containing protein [Trichonephila clavipes]|nr:HTH_Tnp_Tc3_2 domain-containing protein [Trichonephila clavipes]